ncbi:uncharacterized protein LOC110694575 [Chenopodium quinoa]|uniref:uncharacterized protein LOC110694575 n=1 Tax=Chenopodium quinoa TaxID=63459 RepID=UPI000B786E25|nr:uncharacterized protein LOC110694575 [Chenopodium quinoa]
MVNQAEFAALLDELKKINARLDKSEEVTALLQQELHNREPPPLIRNHTVEEIKLADLPSFDGDGDPDLYLDWERRMERIFAHKNLDDHKHFNHAILKITRYASLWFDSMQNNREREGKPQLSTWTDLKTKMKKRFVPRSYKQDLYLKLNSLTQGYMSVANYTKEFERLYIACDCKDEEEQKIAKFVIGLNTSLRNQVEVLPLTTFDDVCMIACKLEKQKKPYPSIKPQTENYDIAPGSLDATSKHDKLVSNLKQGQSSLPQSQQKMKQIVCFKCQGMGHLAKQCPNKALITKEEYYTFLSQNVDELDVCYAENEPKSLIIRRSLLPTLDEKEDEQKSNLFHSKCLINGKVCSFIIDSGSCTNACALSMVDSLQLPTRKHPQSYKLSWFNDDNGVWVKKQTLIGCKVGDYVDQIWCDAVPMTACSLLLGQPWQSDRHVFHNGKTNVYSVLIGDKRLALHPLPPIRPPMPKEQKGGVAHVCFSSCHQEVLDCSNDKRERRDKLLQMRKGTNLQEGSKVWLSLNAQRMHIDHKNGEPMDEGPFDIVEKVGYETFKVLLGNGVCATLPSSDLVPCFEDET